MTVQVGLNYGNIDQALKMDMRRDVDGLIGMRDGVVEMPTLQLVAQMARQASRVIAALVVVWRLPTETSR